MLRRCLKLMSKLAKLTMQMTRLIACLFAVGVVAIYGLLYQALALDVKKPVMQNGVVSYPSALDALNIGLQNYDEGDKAGAAHALEYAATHGEAIALWKLGRMYADGDGVPHDDLKAFEYFSRIVDDASEDKSAKQAKALCNAYVSLGAYFLEGIKGTYVKADPVRAREIFQYAATYYSDARAQYNLGRMYLEGVGMERNPRQAARWLNLASEKGHASSQALLGSLLVSGNGVSRQRAKGVMWLTMARDAADPDKEQWVLELYNKTMNELNEEDQKRLANENEIFELRAR